MLVVLSSALDHAAKRGLVVRNVARLVDRPKIEHREMSTWTPAEAATFRDHSRADRLHACWLLTLAGLRRLEVLGLRWTDVDLDAGTVSVAQGRVVVQGEGTMTGDPKSHRSRRVLPMPADVIAALRSLKAAQAADRLALGDCWPDTGLVAVNSDGSPIRPEPKATRASSLGSRKPLGCRRSDFTTSVTPLQPSCSAAGPTSPPPRSGLDTTLR